MTDLVAAMAEQARSDMAAVRRKWPGEFSRLTRDFRGFESVAEQELREKQERASLDFLRQFPNRPARAGEIAQRANRPARGVSKMLSSLVKRGLIKVSGSQRVKGKETNVYQITDAARAILKAGAKP